MSQFIFVTSEGRFPIPDGESRVGSDSACAVCVHGEGILPVHAYLKVEGEKVMIRPFNEKAAIMVESAPASGPLQLQAGHRVSLGPVQMRLITERATWHFPWRVFAYLAGGVAALVVLLVLLRFLWFNEGWWKAQILSTVEQAVGRENASIEKLDLYMLDGRILVHNLTIANREPFPEDSNLLEVPEMEISIDVWQFLRSRFSEIRSGRLTLTNPVLKIERIARDDRALSNVDDLFPNLSRYASEGLRTLAALEGEVAVTGGRVEFKDKFAGSESALADISLNITQKGFEQKLSVELQARPQTGTPTTGTTPRLGLTGNLRLFDAAGRIDPEAIGDGKFILSLESFDLARLCQHLRWEWKVRGGQQKIVPGKPVTGELKISFSNLERCEATGTLESESLVSLLEPDQPPLGNIPTVMAIDRLTYDFGKGWPSDLEVNLRADRTLEAARSYADATALVMRASLRRSATGEEHFEVDLRSRLQDLCATDVGERLKLKGRLEGGLKASIAFVREAANEVPDAGRGPQTAIKGTIELDRSARVLVPSPLPAGEGRWQPLRLTADLNAVAGSTPKGELTDIKGRIKAASDSFSIESTEDTELNSLDRLDQFSLKTRMKVQLQGREFWDQYGPVLSLFGLDRPIEEQMTLDFMALSTTVPSGPRAGTRQVKIGCEGEAARQWAANPAPVFLRFILDYYPEAYAAALQNTKPSETPPDPYLILKLQTGTEQQQPYAHVKNAEVSRNGDSEIIRMPSIVIQSDMDAFEERFRPYLKWACDFLGTDLLERYRVSGMLGSEGSLTITRPVKRFAVGTQPFEAAFQFKVEGRNLKPSGPVFALSENPEETPRRWSWTEPAPQMSLEGTYRYRPAPSKEEPDVRRFDSLKVKMQGELGAFSLGATDLDLFLLEKLATRARVLGKSWPDAAGSLQIAGSVKPAAFDLLRKLELPGLKSWLTDPLVSGTLRLNASYNRRDDVAQLSELVYQQEAGVQNAFWLRDLDLVARLHSVRALANEIFGRPRGTPLEAVKLLQHLSEGLVIRRLIFDAPSFASWLSSRPAEEMRENSFADFVPSGLASLLRTRTVDPQGPWIVNDMGVEAIANQEQAWRVYGRFQSDVLVTLPPECSFSRSSLAPVLMFKGPWTLPEKDAASLTLARDGQYMYLSMRTDLDATDLSLRNLYPAWVYLKDANQPLRLNVDGLFPLRLGGEAQLFSFKTLALNGGALDVTLEDGQARLTTTPDGRVIDSVTLRDGTIKGGPLFSDCHLQSISYSRADDQLIGRMTARRLDVPVLARILPRFPGWSYEGRVDELTLDVRGTLASILSFKPDPVRDRVRADVRCENLLLTADAGHGERAVLEVNGDVGLTPTRIDGKDLRLILLHYTTGAGAPLPVPSKHVVRLPELLIATQQQEQGLRQAFEKQPYPLQLNLPLNFDTPVEVDQLAEAWQTVRKVHYKGKLPEPGTPPTNPYDVLRAIRADGALRAPALTLGRWVLNGLDIPRYSLRDLKLNVPLCAVKCAGGDLILNTAFYDLNHPEVSHSQKFELTKADLKALLGLGADDYRVNGGITIEGELQGIGITPGASWEGTADLHLRGATIDPPQAFTPTNEIPADAPFAQHLPPLLREALKQVAGQPQVTTAQMLAGLNATGPAAPWDALFTATGLTLAGFGLPVQKLEFEPARLQTVITHGIAELRPVRLVGRGASLGLELSATGKVRLSDGSIDDPLVIHPLQLPPEARKVLRLDDWSRIEREAFMDDLSKSRLALRVTGTWKDAKLALPLKDLRERVRLAMPPPPPPPANPPQPGKEPVKPQPLPEEDPSLPPEQALLLIFNRLSKQP